ncbi:AbiV family abortive infection protein [Pseudotabrizicola algicola]|uniref:AbiV family abortive infection protein n=1 Tax=Pseudotabrizicola algicola TaxID=2709381 RepID=A0A6B3RYX6_9RHOB|nr:AbiV family abortive infection protein [Pseudotabrizicola algicola]NEX48322.1 AbiV family abortive infection protein [Pseudotabrizicola algicola]
MGSPNLPTLTAALLLSYSEAALRNADELLAEASLLCEYGHIARAYFLAVACIEEAGKALFAFDSQNRNLSDPAVCTKLKKVMESHALSVWALSSPDQRESIKVASIIIVDIKHGREPSMYSDLRTDPDRVQTPREVVRDSAARDCVRLAKDCLAYAHRHGVEKTPATFTTAQDRLFSMKSARFQELLKIEDFWWYYIWRMEAGQQDLAEAVLGYEQDHIKTGMPFCAAP